MWQQQRQVFQIREEFVRWLATQIVSQYRPLEQQIILHIIQYDNWKQFLSFTSMRPIIPMTPTTTKLREKIEKMSKYNVSGPLIGALLIGFTNTR